MTVACEWEICILALVCCCCGMWGIYLDQLTDRPPDAVKPKPHAASEPRNNALDITQLAY